MVKHKTAERREKNKGKIAETTVPIVVPPVMQEVPLPTIASSSPQKNSDSPQKIQNPILLSESDFSLTERENFDLFISILENNPTAPKPLCITSFTPSTRYCCTKKCFSKFSESRLDRLVADYKENHKSPCNFVLQHCSLENFKTSENQRFVFSFTNDLGRRCSVCRTFLLKIFGIGVSTVQRARNLFKKQILAASDNRGKHSNRVNRITEEAKEEMDMHFKSLNAVPSHYTESNLLYIEQPNSDLLTKHQAYLEYLALAKKPMSETKWNELRIEKFPNYVFTSNGVKLTFFSHAITVQKKIRKRFMTWKIL